MAKKASNGNLRKIPSVDAVLKWAEIKKYIDSIENRYIATLVRTSVSVIRKELLSGKTFTTKALKQRIIHDIDELLSPYFCYAINATGIILHTGLGRAPFSKGIADVIYTVSKGFSRLQIDNQGRRADRYAKINRLLQIITGAEAGFIVNNNAAATLLALNTLAKGREVIVSRGQLVEIGGAYRMPEIMETSGAIMREVGTTNRTHLEDYEKAIGQNTAALMRVHQSNFRIIGFTKQVPLNELIQLGKKHNIPVIDDLGSGAFIDFSKYGLPKEPTVQESIQAGADVACFSGDKLIGGPQCGIIVGATKYIEQMKKNPLTRAMRCDKLTNASLEATLQLFLRKESTLLKEHGVFNALLKKPTDIKRHATKCAELLKRYFKAKIEVTIKEDVSEIGGGSLSTEELPTYVIAIKPKTVSVQELATALRTCRIPVFGRVTENTYILDFRTVLENEEKHIVEAFKSVLQ